MFETERLDVRRMQPSDVDDLERVYGDADAMRWVDDGRAITRVECERWLDVTRRNYRARGYGMSVLVERASGRVIGFCGLVHPGGQEQAEIKYALERGSWGRGLATEAAAGMLAYGAREHGLDTVIATTAPENHASHRVLLKVGMTRAEVVHEDDGTPVQVFRWRAGGAATGA